jgi:flagellar hook protein FlgE
MMRSLYSAVSGLRNHQTRMDVIGNNISNVNTIAFKGSRVVFQDIYSQTSKGASAGVTLGTGPVVGGTNPMQIGLGVTIGAIDTIHSSAATQRTDNVTDLAIEGDGFFIIDTNGAVTGGSDPYVSNGGIFYTRAGNLYVDNAGYLVNSSGNFILGYVNTSPTAATPGGADASMPPTSGSLSAIRLVSSDTPPVPYVGITIDENGLVQALNANEEKLNIAYIPIATFVNTSGLEKVGSSLYAATNNSGTAAVHLAGAEGAGKINPGGLEMSNVDLAAEFTDMIVTQRGFQANSRVITVSDTLLEELINLKR